MTVSKALANAARRLKQTSDSPRLDAEVLLAAIRKTGRAALIADGREELSPDEEQTFHAWIHLRSGGLPVAYLTGYQEFHGLTFNVSPDVLIPRPVTELLVDEVVRRLPASAPVTIADVGTGSGAIALSLAMALPHAQVTASDISPQALSMAHYNVRHSRLSQRVNFMYGSLLEPWRDRPAPDVIVANLPYLRSDQLSEPSIQAEPTIALDGGPDGLRLIWQFLDQLPWVHPIRGLVLELDPSQIETVAQYLAGIWPQYSLDTVSDGRVGRGLVMWQQ